MKAKTVASKSTLEANVVVTMTIDEATRMLSALRNGENAAEARYFLSKSLAARAPMPSDSRYLATLADDVQNIHDIRVAFERANSRMYREDIEVID